MPSLTEKVKAKARELGFTLAGVTTPDPPQSFPVYQEWLAAGHHAGMAYLASERALTRRTDPRRILPECQSILVLGIPYNASNPDPPPPDHGRVAAYAWGNDYHEVLKPRLQTIVAFLESETGETIPNRWYTDTGPLLERDLAQRAGLGWIGKNSMLIHPQQGSYFFLAEILLGIPLDSDPPFPTDHCGTCTRCIQACPTHCILPDRTLDARRCISYLTIEHRGDIPPDLQPLIGSWVFGCDICQQVCPWNRFAPQQGDPAFQPRPGLPTPNLDEETALTPETFSKKFRDSPVKRAKYAGYMRNVGVVRKFRG